ncbi:unnamed protein product [Urochloa humidicola]
MHIYKSIRKKQISRASATPARPARAYARPTTGLGPPDTPAHTCLCRRVGTGAGRWPPHALALACLRLRARAAATDPPPACITATPRTAPPPRARLQRDKEEIRLENGSEEKIRLGEEKGKAGRR